MDLVIQMHQYKVQVVQVAQVVRAVQVQAVVVALGVVINGI